LYHIAGLVFGCQRGWLIFFFQAEDGIRDRNVTGVQTCALPIWLDQPFFVRYLDFVKGAVTGDLGESYVTKQDVFSEIMARMPARSEERRVGKECGAGWWSWQ